MSELIDTTEMYLKTVYELEEEGIPALRARIVDRLGQSGPTVSETVARLERDGLLRIGAGRQIQFTDAGFYRAEGVMRRHRLVERLLLDVIKVDWANVHDEACRWEHVVSDAVADKIEKLLNYPDVDPFGNPIPPALAPDDEGEVSSKALQSSLEDGLAGLVSLVQVAKDGIGKEVTLTRFSERVQSGLGDLREFDRVGLKPGAVVEVRERTVSDVVVGVAGQQLLVPLSIAEGLYVAE